LFTSSFPESKVWRDKVKDTERGKPPGGWWGRKTRKQSWPWEGTKWDRPYPLAFHPWLPGPQGAVSLTPSKDSDHLGVQERAPKGRLPQEVLGTCPATHSSSTIRTRVSLLQNSKVEKGEEITLTPCLSSPSHPASPPEGGFPPRSFCRH
jgi:hypothetical protein